jgi:hypothetical protein
MWPRPLTDAQREQEIANLQKYRGITKEIAEKFLDITHTDEFRTLIAKMHGTPPGITDEEKSRYMELQDKILEIFPDWQCCR